MRNKNQKTVPFRWMLKRYLFLLVIVLILTFAIFPMQGMVRVLNQREYLDYLEEPLTPEDQSRITSSLTLDFVYSPLDLEILCLVIGGMGFAAALALFGHLFSRKQSMMYAALPMTRTKDFWLRTGVYGICCLVPMALCMAIHPIMVRANGMWELFRFGTYLRRVLVALLINLYGYALGAFCSAVFGTVWSAAAGGILLGGGIELTLVIWVRIAHMYLRTMYTVEATRSLLKWSPVYSLYKAFYQPNAYSVLAGIAGIAVLLALACLVRRAVKPENAGHTLNLKKAEPVLLAWMSVLGGTAGALVMSMYLGREFMLVLGIILGVCAAWLLTRMLTEQRIHLDFSAWKIPAAALCAMLIALVCLRTDALGYDRYAPRAENLRAVSVTREAEGDSIRFETGEGIRACVNWTAAARDEMLAEKSGKPYESSWANMQVVFEDRNGRKTTRQFQIPSASVEMLPDLRTLAAEIGKYQSEHIQNTERDSVSIWSALPAFGLSDYDFQETYGFSTERLGRVKAAEIREALRKDLAERTLEDMQEMTLFSVQFNGMNVEEDGKVRYRYSNYEVRPSDRNALKAVLGEDADKWIAYARGGFVDNADILVFLCEYSQDEDGEWTVLDNYRMAESAEEARQWLSQVSFCRNNMFIWPEEEGKTVEIYSLANLRERQSYDEDFQLDLENPETLRRLPELDGGSHTYRFMIPEQSR